MDGRVTFNSLAEGINELDRLAQSLDDPIERYNTEASRIGEDGAEAWGGTAATNAQPVLNTILNDIHELQNMISDFAAKANISLGRYAEAEAAAEKAVSELENVG